MNDFGVTCFLLAYADVHFKTGVPCIYIITYFVPTCCSITSSFPLYFWDNKNSRNARAIAASFDPWNGRFQKGPYHICIHICQIYNESFNCIQSLCIHTHTSLYEYLCSNGTEAVGVTLGKVRQTSYALSAVHKNTFLQSAPLDHNISGPIKHVLFLILVNCTLIPHVCFKLMQCNLQQLKDQSTASWDESQGRLTDSPT